MDEKQDGNIVAIFVINPEDEKSLHEFFPLGRTATSARRYSRYDMQTKLQLMGCKLLHAHHIAEMVFNWLARLMNETERTEGRESVVQIAPNLGEFKAYRKKWLPKASARRHIEIVTPKSEEGYPHVPPQSHENGPPQTSALLSTAGDICSPTTTSNTRQDFTITTATQTTQTSCLGVNLSSALEMAACHQPLQQQRPLVVPSFVGVRSPTTQSVDTTTLEACEESIPHNYDSDMEGHGSRSRQRKGIGHRHHPPPWVIPPIPSASQQQQQPSSPLSPPLPSPTSSVNVNFFNLPLPQATPISNTCLPTPALTNGSVEGLEDAVDSSAIGPGLPWHQRFSIHNGNAVALLSTSEFHHVMKLALRAFKYKKNTQIEEFRVACEIGHTIRPLVILFGGTSGCGKSTVASLLASRLGISTVLSTDSVRHVLRNFRNKEEHGVLFSSTYHAGECISSDPRYASLTPQERVIKGYEAQCALVVEKLDDIISMCEQRNQSIVVEGVHLHTDYVVQLMRRHPSCIPFLVYISNEQKHKERFAIRAKYMTLEARSNKYIRYFENIRVIQDHLCARAIEHGLPMIDNTNIDRSLAVVHYAVFSSVKRLARGEKLFDETLQRANIPKKKHPPFPYSSKRTLRLIALKRSGSLDSIAQHAGGGGIGVGGSGGTKLEMPSPPPCPSSGGSVATSLGSKSEFSTQGLSTSSTTPTTEDGESSPRLIGSGGGRHEDESPSPTEPVNYATELAEYAVEPLEETSIDLDLSPKQQPRRVSDVSGMIGILKSAQSPFRVGGGARRVRIGTGRGVWRQAVLAHGGETTETSETTDLTTTTTSDSGSETVGDESESQHEKGAEQSSGGGGFLDESDEEGSLLGS